MRVFQSLEEASLEIRRDLYKSPLVEVTRVQQRVNQELEARERLGMTYALLPEAWPKTAEDLVRLGAKLELPQFLQHPYEMLEWLKAEEEARLMPENYLGKSPTELIHPALRTTIEGNFPSYTYHERLYGAIDVLAATLQKSPDSRRAYWPIYHPHDSLRAMDPTRVPCSLGYEALIRMVNGKPHLILFYLQRSADYDTFWLTDVWLARKFQDFLTQELNSRLQYKPDYKEVISGQLVHHIISFHSFFAAGSEVY